MRAEIETFDDITFAAIYNLRKGTRIQFRQRRLEETYWVTEGWGIRYKARIALLYRLDAELTGTYSNSRRFTTDTSVTGWSAKE